MCLTNLTIDPNSSEKRGTYAEIYGILQRSNVNVCTGNCDGNSQDICNFTGSLTGKTQPERHKSKLLALLGEIIIPLDYSCILPQTDWKTYLVPNTDMLDLCQ